MSLMIVRPARKPRAEYVEYDPLYPEVAERVIEHASRCGVAIEHVGSTSVPGCGGKGVVDLVALVAQAAPSPRRSRSET